MAGGANIDAVSDHILQLKMMKISILLIVSLAIALLLSSCTSAGITATPTITDTQLPLTTRILPTITVTTFSIETATSTLSLLSTPPSTQTATAPPPPTLETEQARNLIKALLREPEDCAATCFWGIVPGKTKFAEAKNILSHLGLEIIKGTGNRYGTNIELDSGLSLLITLTTKVHITGDVVESLRIGITPEQQKSGVPREWLTYSPETLINRYGLPSRVVFALDWGPRSFFDMVMYFDKVDLIVEYSGYDIIHKETASPQICPLTAQFDSVELWMGKDALYPPGGGSSLEETTGMTIEEFSKVITGDPDKACFELNGEMSP